MHIQSWAPPAFLDRRGGGGGGGEGGGGEGGGGPRCGKAKGATAPGRVREGGTPPAHAANRYGGALKALPSGPAPRTQDLPRFVPHFIKLQAYHSSNLYRLKSF